MQVIQVVLQMNATMTTGTSSSVKTGITTMTTGRTILKDMTRCPDGSTNKHPGCPQTGNATFETQHEKTIQNTFIVTLTTITVSVFIDGSTNKIQPLYLSGVDGV